MQDIVESVETTAPYTVKLPLFEGPLDLLLHLIQKNELDITAISLAKVADQFVEHMHRLQDVQPGVIADFLVIASKLLVIKSRLLLPRPPAIDEEEEDPGQALARRLREYKRFKDAAAALQLLESQDRRCHVRVAPPPEMETRIDWGALSLDDLIVALRQLLTIAPADDIVESVITRRKITVGEKMEWIARLLAEHSSVPFHRVVGRSATRVDIVVSLWAVLELIKRGRLQARQAELFGDILLFPLEETPVVV
ncbi:MAG: segregation/condensation protein A [Anaerolineae bacterium]|mgnify:CR=1 FL=1|nr:segregation/condensation protein A [Anaerolineae bacterium]MCB9130696.1 segregation/condensation protein A [Anaerolineales bacterium]MCB0228181.1 segregation/condensation protein A [Anaerolineae bacterium]MCB0235794.1 segregation/condensation protein A [Anaerolineae bacterium]MCB0239774.1 segregation/condensation protein A [Anaerolineae bacterium]